MGRSDMVLPQVRKRRQNSQGNVLASSLLISLVVSLVFHGALLWYLSSVGFTLTGVTNTVEDEDDATKRDFWDLVDVTMPDGANEESESVADGEKSVVTRSGEVANPLLGNDEKLLPPAPSAGEIPQAPETEFVTVDKIPGVTDVKIGKLEVDPLQAVPTPMIEVTKTEMPEVPLPDVEMPATETVGKVEPDVTVGGGAVQPPQLEAGEGGGSGSGLGDSDLLVLPLTSGLGGNDGFVVRTPGGGKDGAPSVAGSLAGMSIGGGVPGVGKGAGVGGRGRGKGWQRPVVILKPHLGDKALFGVPGEEGETVEIPKVGVVDMQKLIDDVSKGEGGLLPPKPLDNFVTVKVRVMHEADGSGYYQALIEPNAKSDSLKPVAKDVLFIVDHSGSISGTRLSQFKMMTQQALSQLGSEDRFNIVSFASHAAMFFKDYVPPTPANIQQARRHLQSLVSSGTTDIFGGVGPFVKMSNGKPERPLIVFVMTDGQSTISMHRGELEVDNTNVKAVLNAIVKSNPGNVSIYPFSAGRDADRVLLDFMARLNCGTPLHVANGGNFRGELATYLRTHMSLLVRNFRYRAEGRIENDIYPRRLPHLYRNESLSIYGRFEPGEEEMVLTLLGYDAVGELRNLAFRCRFADCEEVKQDALEGGEVSLKEQWTAQMVLQKLADWLESYTPQTAASPEMRRRKQEINRLLGTITAFSKYSNLLQ